ncbi:putative short-chain oxidoreductase [Biscogniauxia marginata]|nr:putative short-chain oxidoreductase [Biscogniauxia marginata]
MASHNVVQKPLTWLITGSSSGFGLALVRLAQASGHRVIATSRNPGRTPELVEEVVQKGGQWIKLDVDDLNCGEVIKDFEAQGTEIDVLVNSAGFAIVGPVESFKEEEVRRIMETNFLGPYRLMRAVVPYMRTRRSGVIVNLSSGSGMEARETLGVYGASKSALDAISKVLHKEMADFGVRVLLVYLGTFDTPMAKSNQEVQSPIDPSYDGTATKLIFDIMRSGNFALPGDHLKAVQAIYDVVVGQGPGKGAEREMMLPLGIDMAEKIEETRDRLDHMMDIFGDLCKNVNVDKTS